MSFEKVFLCLGLLLPACSSSSSGSPSSPGPDAGGPADAPGSAEGSADAPAGDAGAEAAEDGPVVCNTLTNSASTVTITQVASDPPAFEGGTVGDGTYLLTSETEYTGPGGASGPTSRTDRTTIQISGGTIQVAKITSPPTDTYALTTSGTTYTAAGECPPSLGSIVGSFTATPTTFTVSIAAPGGDGGAPWQVDVFAKQ